MKTLIYGGVNLSCIPLDRIIFVTYLSASKELVMIVEDGGSSGKELRIRDEKIVEKWWNYFTTTNIFNTVDTIDKKKNANVEEAAHTKLSRVIRGAVTADKESTGVDNLNVQHLKSIEELANLEARGLIKFVEDVDEVKEETKSKEDDEVKVAPKEEKKKILGTVKTVKK